MQECEHQHSKITGHNIGSVFKLLSSVQSSIGFVEKSRACTCISAHRCHVSLAQVSDFALLEIIKKAESAFAREQDIVESVLEHDALDSPIRDPENGPSALKHLRQNASLLGHLGQAGLLRVRTSAWLTLLVQ